MSRLRCCQEIASSAESVGVIRPRKLAHVVRQSQYRYFYGPETVRLSRHQIHLVIEPFHCARRCAVMAYLCTVLERGRGGRRPPPPAGPPPCRPLQTSMLSTTG